MHSLRAAVAVLMAASLSVFAGCADVHQAYMPSNRPIAAAGLKIESGNLDSRPKFVEGQSPIYPISKALDREGGEAVVEFIIGNDGKTKAIKVLSCTEKTFGVNARFAVRDWVFAPARKNGQPVEAKAHIAFRFYAAFARNSFA